MLKKKKKKKWCQTTVICITLNEQKHGRRTENLLNDSLVFCTFRSFRTDVVLEEFRKCILPRKWLYRTTDGTIRKCSSRVFQ
jgi:hypothetical protein